MTRAWRWWLIAAVVILTVATTVALTRQQNVINRLEHVTEETDALIAQNIEIIDANCEQLKANRVLLIDIMIDLRDTPVTDPDIDAALQVQIDALTADEVTCLNR